MNLHYTTNPKEAAKMAEQLIIDMHEEFLKICKRTLQKVREGDLKFLQSFVISMIIRDIWTRNNAKLPPDEAKAKAKEEIQKLCEGVGLEIDNLEKFLADVAAGGVL